VREKGKIEGKHDFLIQALTSSKESVVIIIIIIMLTCFVCNLPILSHQVGLVWQGGNGVDDLLREQMENVSWDRQCILRDLVLEKKG